MIYRQYRTAAVSLCIALISGALLPTAVAKEAKLTTIPKFWWIYKYAPDEFTDSQMLRLAKDQVIRDQQAYMHPNPKGHGFVFSKQQVSGRAPEFAARELLPVYKKALAAEAGRIPENVQIEEETDLRNIDYSSGALHQKENNNLLMEIYTFPPEKKLKLPSQGAREVGSGKPMLGRVDSHAITSNRTYLHPRKHFYIAFDRVPAVPPVRMNPAAAEQLWKRPGRDCMALASHAAESIEAMRAYKKCMTHASKYTHSLRSVFHVLVEGLVVTERAYIVKAKINKVDLYGPTGAQITSLDGSDLSPAQDSWAQHEAEMQAQKAAETAAQIEKKEKLAAMQNEVRAADIAGLTLDMSFSEAETKVRQKMSVNRIYERKSENKTRPFMDDIRGFESEDGSDKIYLYKAKPGTDELVAISQIIKLPSGIEMKDVKDKLLEKYGEPTRGSDSSGYLWHGLKDEKRCRLSVDWTHLPVVSGERPKKYEKYNSMLLSNIYPISPDSFTEMKDNCGPVLFAKISKLYYRGVAQPYLFVAVYDLAKYAAANATKSANKTDFDLDL